MAKHAEIEALLPGEAGGINDELCDGVGWMLGLECHVFCAGPMTAFAINAIDHPIQVESLRFQVGRRCLVSVGAVAFEAAGSDGPVEERLVGRELGAVSPFVRRGEIGDG